MVFIEMSLAHSLLFEHTYQISVVFHVTPGILTYAFS